jgi:hypothetical protein
LWSRQFSHLASFSIEQSQSQGDEEIFCLFESRRNATSEFGTWLNDRNKIFNRHEVLGAKDISPDHDDR